MTDVYGLSGSFGLRVSSKSIGHNAYTGMRLHFCSKPTPIHRPVQKYYLKYSYSGSHFSWLTQVVS